MDESRREYDRAVPHLIVGLACLLAIPCSVSLAGPAGAPMTSSGLNTTISAPIILPSGQTQYNITGGTRPGGGVNLFHSFGTLNVPNNNIANFLNTSGLPTSNILGRVTGGNLSNILGTIQTTGFGNANLFLINPAGFLFGPNATMNVGGMVTFSSADYLKLSDGAMFNAVPKASVDALLSAAPVVAFGFLGSNPGTITVQGSHLSVAGGTGISLVGGNITVQAATLTAPSGQINLVSVNKPSNAKTGGEVVVNGLGQGTGFTPTGFKSLGTVNLSQGSNITTSQTAGSGHAGGQIVIRGGRFVMNGSVLEARAPQAPQGVAGGHIQVTADEVVLSNHSSVDTSTSFGSGGATGNVTFNVDTFSATDSSISTNVRDGGTAGAVTIQGLQGSGASAHTVSLTNTTIDTSSMGLPGFPGPPKADGGPIVVRADNIVLNKSTLNALSFETFGGPISLVSRNQIESHDSSFIAASFSGSGGTVDLRAGTRISLLNTSINAHGFGINGGNITLASPRISIIGGRLEAATTSGGIGHGGMISLTGDKAVSLSGTLLTADGLPVAEGPNAPLLSGNGGSILINAGKHFTSKHSTLSAQSAFKNGGTIQANADKVSLTDTQLTTSVSGGPQTVGGKITINANRLKVTNSQILSTATEGHGGTIGVTTNKIHLNNSVIDASSQFGTNGTVTVQHP